MAGGRLSCLVRNGGGPPGEESRSVAVASSDRGEADLDQIKPLERRRDRGGVCRKGKGDPWRHWLSLKTWNRLWCVIPYDTASDNGSAFQGRVPAIRLSCRPVLPKRERQTADQIDQIPSVERVFGGSAASVSVSATSSLPDAQGVGSNQRSVSPVCEPKPAEDAGITLPIVLTGLGSGACSKRIWSSPWSDWCRCRSRRPRCPVRNQSPAPSMVVCRRCPSSDLVDVGPASGPPGQGLASKSRS